MSYSAEKQLWIFHLVATRTVISFCTRTSHISQSIALAVISRSAIKAIANGNTLCDAPKCS